MLCSPVRIDIVSKTLKTLHWLKIECLHIVSKQYLSPVCEHGLIAYW